MKLKYAHRRGLGRGRASGLVACVLLGCAVIVGAAGCGQSGAARAARGGSAPAPSGVPSFDGERALALIRQQCAFGPRAPGSEGHRRMLEWLVGMLKRYADQVYEQRFQARTPFGGPYEFCNVLARLGPDEGRPFLLMAHWDTRPVADEDPEPNNRNTPILGANDGGSGVAVLLEIGRLMSQTQPPVPVVMAFVDAEDSGRSAYTEMPYAGFCIGSAYLAAHWPEGWPRPEEGILVDLVGGDGKPVPRIPVSPIHGDVKFDLGLEGNSLDANPALVNKVWSTAERLGHEAFVRKPVGPIIDDHVPMIEAGVRMIDIIEVFPVTWHTVDDTPEHCSADSLRQVGDTLMHVIYELL